MKHTGAKAAALLAVLMICLIPAGSSAADTSHLGGHAESSGMIVDYDGKTGYLQFQLVTDAKRIQFTILGEDGGLMGPYAVGNDNGGLIQIEGFLKDNELGRGMNLISVTSDEGMLVEFRLYVQAAYTLSFDPNGAKGIIPFISVSPGESVTLPDCTLRSPTSDPFGGWMIDGEIHQKGERIKVGGDTLAKASWGQEPQTTGNSDWVLLIAAAVILITAIAIVLIVRRMRI